MSEQSAHEVTGFCGSVPIEYEDDTPSYGETMAAAHREMIRWRTTLDWLADH